MKCPECGNERELHNYDTQREMLRNVKYNPERKHYVSLWKAVKYNFFQYPHRKCVLCVTRIATELVKHQVEEAEERKAKLRAQISEIDDQIKELKELI